MSLPNAEASSSKHKHRSKDGKDKESKHKHKHKSDKKSSNKKSSGTPEGPFELRVQRMRLSVPPKFSADWLEGVRENLNGMLMQ